MKIMTKYQKHLDMWAKYCLDNYQHKTLLIEAEIASLENEFATGMALYKQAIDSARDYRYSNLTMLD